MGDVGGVGQAVAQAASRMATAASGGGLLGSSLGQHPLWKTPLADALQGTNDAVALAAARALDSGQVGEGGGGLNVVASNPLSISNPIKLLGGNYDQVRYAVIVYAMTS